jgi:hypothetical protein
VFYVKHTESVTFNVIFLRLQATAESKLADLKKMSATGLQHAIQQQNIMDLNVDLQAPYIIVPHGGFYSGYVRCDLLVFMLTGCSKP